MSRRRKGGFFTVRTLRDWWQALEQLIFPPNIPCGLCGQYPRLPVGACKLCLDSLAILWDRRDVHGQACFSLFPYQGLGRDLIHRLKFQSCYEIAHTLGHFLGLAAREEPELAKVDVLVPVPLSPGRLQQRGFNQAETLADSIREVWKRPICRNVVRTRETQSQSGLSSAGRRRNLQGAFAVLPGFDFQGKHCLIVDDVITSGHTFCSLAQLIVQYGGKCMGIFVARTEILRSEGMLKNCEACNRVFAHPTRVLCQECHEKAQRAFEVVKDYLQKNPGATVVEVAQATEVDLELIYEYIRQGRLSVVPKDAQLRCAICGNPIDLGKVCRKCREGLKKGSQEELETRPADKPQSRSTRIHYLDQIRDRK